MSFLEIFTLFASGVTIFGVIVGVFSVYNGRRTQSLIRETHRGTLAVIQETRDLIAREEAATRQLIQENQAATREILLRLAEILGRIDERVR